MYKSLWWKLWNNFKRHVRINSLNEHTHLIQAIQRFHPNTMGEDSRHGPHSPNMAANYEHQKGINFNFTLFVELFPGVKIVKQRTQMFVPKRVMQ
jgi:hypothetical protein